MSGVKLCKNAWLTADRFQFIFTRLIGKSDNAYQRDVKKAKKQGRNIDSVKKYTIKETYPKTILRALEVALEYSLLDSKLLQEDTSTDTSKDEGKRPVGAKKLENLTKLVVSSKEDIIETFKGTLQEFTKEAVMMKEENAKMKEQIKKLKEKLVDKGINE